MSMTSTNSGRTTGKIRRVVAPATSIIMLTAALVAVTSPAEAAPAKKHTVNRGRVTSSTTWSGTAALAVPASSKSAPPPTAHQPTGSWTADLPTAAPVARTITPADSTAAGSGAISDDGSRWQSLPTTPIRVGAVAGGAHRFAISAQGAGSSWNLTVQRADGQAASSPVAIQIPSTTLQGLFGGDYASRVRWVQTDADGQTTALPQSWNASRTAMTITPTASATSSTMKAASQPVSTTGTGSFAATSLSAAGSWAVSTQSGGFSWSDDMRVPPAAAGPSPSVALNYNSQSTDGESGSTNNQPSDIGEGWSLGGGGFIERSYTSCARDNGASGPQTSSGDLCWKVDNATISFGGHSGALIKDSTTGTWRLQDDDGSRLEHLTGGTNGTYDGDYWRLTTTDGTQYFFGLNRLPGWTTGATTTNSAWSVPVFGNDTGEPCHAATFAASSCAQAWRWNLDYVVDPVGRAETLYYATEGNLYHSAASTAASYVRGGQLTRIEYGLTAGTVYAANAASDKVTYSYAWRCAATSGCGSGAPANSPDVPWDQNCAAAPCTPSSPTFWSTQMLTTVTTSYLSGSTYSAADVWTLGHSYPATGDTTSAALWLTGVTHQGTVAGNISLPTTTFTGTAMQNRVWVTDGLAPLMKYRLTSIKNEAGGIISVAYSGMQCTAGNAATIEANAATNTQRCYPQFWSPSVTPPQPSQKDLFHLYVVTSVTASPTTGGGQDRADETHYNYTGTPAFRYDISPTAVDSDRTWSDYTGYNTVEVRHGSSTADQTAIDYLYYQGMDGDRAGTSGGTKSVSVHASDGSTSTDSRWLAGRTREAKTLTGVNGSVLSSVITTAWTSAVTANDGGRQARMVGDGDVVTTEPLSTGATRRSETTTAYDGYGRVTQVNDKTVDAGTVCTTTSYTTNTSAWLLDYPSEVAKVGVDCSSLGTATYPAAGLGDVKTAYDGQPVGTAVSKGLVTQTQTVKAYSGTTASTAQWLITATLSYDTLGRATVVKDALNRASTTAYTPAGSGPLTSSTVTNPLTWTITTALNPAWGAVTSVTDQNGHITTASYDALGRRLAVWQPDHLQSANPNLPSTSYAYTVSQTNPSTVRTTTLISSAQVTSFDLYDGLGRIRQRQEQSDGSGAIMSDTLYDAAGRANLTDSWYTTTDPSASLVLPTVSTDSESDAVYDTAGRTTATIFKALNAEAWRTSYSYQGVDRVDVTPPAGGTPTTTYTDTLGHPTKLIQYLSALPGQGTAETTTYGYNPSGDMSSMTDPTGKNTWTWTEDPLGRLVAATDPDTGTTTTKYDDGGRITSTTDGRGKTVAYSYDDLDRKTAQYDSSTTGPKLAAWTYDTVAKGTLSTAVTYVGSTATTLGTPWTVAYSTYDAVNRPTTMKITAPTSAGALAGTYTFTDSWTNGNVHRTQGDPAAGGLPAENLLYGYDAYGMPSGPSVFQGPSYSAGAAYTYKKQLAEVLHQDNQVVYSDYSPNASTGRLMQNDTIIQASHNGLVDNQAYTYDNAGNVTQQVGTQDTGSINAATTTAVTDTQCYTYDALRNLTAAWSSGNAAADACRTTPTRVNVSGPAKYWTKYTVDPATGNRTKSVELALDGGTDITDTTRYPAAGAAHPHAATSVVHSGGASGTDTRTYDAAGNATTRNGQTLTWSVDGRLSAVTAGSQSQNDVYDADGNLLYEKDPVGGATLYLRDTELHLAPGASTVTGIRTYSCDGLGTLAERISKNDGTGGQLYWVATDKNGTVTAEISDADGSVTHRYLDPYGNPRGASAPWLTTHSFLNKPVDAFTALTHVGAREYDSKSGAFISVDPIGKPMDPQQNNGYSYSRNNPTTFTDPTGLDPIPRNCSSTACRNAMYGGANSNPHDADETSASCGGRACGHDPTPDQVNISVRRDRTNSISKDANFTTYYNGAVSEGSGFGPITGAGSGYACYGRAACNAALSYIKAHPDDPNGARQIAANYCIDNAEACYKWYTTAQIAQDILASAWDGPDPSDATSCGGNSFTPDTQVVMADGTHKPLDRIRAGDKVKTTDPATGETRTQTVIKVWINHDVDLMDVSVMAEGRISVVHATQKHLFWLTARNSWVGADQLVVGEALHTDDGSIATVASTVKVLGAGDMWDLTVNEDHDFYVVTTSANILVHNCSPAVQQGMEYMQRRIDGGATNHDLGMTDGQLSQYLSQYESAPRDYVDSDTGFDIIIDRSQSVPIVIVRNSYMIHAYYSTSRNINSKTATVWDEP